MESRELIMRRLLSKEKVDEGLDFKELATMTEGYSGSDLKVSDSIMRHTNKNERKKLLRSLTFLCNRIYAPRQRIAL